MIQNLLRRMTKLLKLTPFRSLEREPRNLTSIYIFSLSSIAFIAILFQFSKLSLYSDQLSAINAARNIEKQIINVDRLFNQIISAQIESNTEVVKEKVESIHNRLFKLEEKQASILQFLNANICSDVSCIDFVQEDYFSRLKVKYLSEKQNTNVLYLENLMSDIKKYRSFMLDMNSVQESQLKNLTKKIIFMDNIFLFFLLLLLLIQAIWGFKPAVKKLNEALRVRSDFISRISHEIRNPMNSILGMAELLQSTPLNSEQVKYTENLQRSSNTLLEMLNKLVDFSGAQSKDIELQPTDFNLQELVDKVIDIVAIQAHNKGLEVFIDLDPRVPKKLKLDFIRLEQVLLNLLSNSIKFTERGHILLQITLIDTFEKSSLVKFSIQDTGIGISKNNLQKIFNSFVQEDSSIKRKYGGSGLGLSICREIIELMGSSISVESDKNEGWSNFYFTLEIQKARFNKILNTSTDEKIKNNILVYSAYEETKPLKDYLDNNVNNFTLVNNRSSLLKNIEKSNNIDFVLIDDSIGVVDMVEIVSVLKKLIPENKIFALIKSNFPKESIETLRLKNYINFLIKPLRIWHIIRPDETAPHSKELNRTSHAHSFNQKKKNILNKNIRILVVDDSKDNLFLIKQMLNHITDQIVFANNGLEACEKISSKDFNFVFMDIQMPIMDGYTAIKKIRKTHPDLPVYAVTAHSSIIDEKKCLEAGFNGRITKPINRNKITSALSTAINLSTLPDDKDLSDSSEKRMVQKLLPAYFNTRVKDLEELKAALKNNDFTSIKKLGHRIKGSAKSYGFPHVGELAHNLEEFAIKEDKGRCEQVLDQIEQSIDLAKNNFEETVNTD